MSFEHDDIEILAAAIHNLKEEIDHLNVKLSKVQIDADRYRWLRDQHWHNATICAVSDPVNAVILGSICPYGKQLDLLIDLNRIGHNKVKKEPSNHALPETEPQITNVDMKTYGQKLYLFTGSDGEPYLSTRSTIDLS